jgi:hypothetical protein
MGHSVTAQKKQNIYIVEPLKMIAVREKANFAGCDLNEFASF